MTSWSSFLLVSIFTQFLFLSQNVDASRKVSCFYNSAAFRRSGDWAKFTVENLKPAIEHCTHLIYGFVSFDVESQRVKSLDKQLDSDQGLNNFKNTTNLRSLSTTMKVLLSVGGFQDPDDYKYIQVLGNADSRASFVRSLVTMVNEYGFDGADLAWQFPVYKEPEGLSIFDKLLYHFDPCNIFHRLYSYFFTKNVTDTQDDYKKQFSALVQELSVALRRNKRVLTLTILPHVKAPEFIEISGIQEYIEHIHLMTYDYKNPWRFKYEADYTASLYHVSGRNKYQNIQQTVEWWLQQKMPAKKLIIAIPTFGRTWKINRRSGRSLIPPVLANGPGEPGPYLKEEGSLAYYEICPILIPAGVPYDVSTLLREIPDYTHRFGTYAYRQNEVGEGIWVSFDSPNVAAEKAMYAKRKGLGGVAIVDLTLDDFRGSCSNASNPFPILRAAKENI